MRLISIFFILFIFSANAQTFVDKRKTLMDSVFEPGDVVVLHGILFNLDKCSLNAWGADSLKLAADLLLKHRNLFIEVGNHSDHVNPNSSQHLTLCRAKAICDSFQRSGIDPSRFSAMGYGDTKPYVLEKDIILPSKKIIPKGTVLSKNFRDKFIKNKEDHELLCQLCRRTELKIVRTDFGRRKTIRDSVFEKGDIVICPRINWDLDDGARIRHSPGRDSADATLTFLKKNKNLVVELGIHTDVRGSSDYNLKLSEVRSRALAEYFLKNGIDSLRIKYKGYGENEPYVLDKPIAVSENSSLLPPTVLKEDLIKKYISDKQVFEMLNGLNRRTELRILETDFGK